MTFVGDAIRAAQAARQCTMTPCKYKAVKYGYCKRHLGLRKKPRTPNYRTVHQRLKRAHGPATAHLCQDCGRQADEWSYDNADPDEGIDPDNECPYSIDLEHYLTRCKSCHRQADYARRVRHRIPLPAAACVQLYYVSDTPLKTISLLFDYSTDDILDELHNAGIPINKPGSAWKWRVRKRTGQRNAEKRRLHRENMRKIQNRDKIESQEQEQNPTPMIESRQTFSCAHTVGRRYAP